MIFDFLEKLFSGSSERNSRQDVKNRLKLVLAHDRAAIAPDMLQAMRREILEVVSRYVELDADEMELSLDSTDRMTVLVANLPIRKVNPQFYTVKEEAITGQTLPEIAIDETLIGETGVPNAEAPAATEAATETPDPPIETAAETAKARLESVVIQDDNELIEN
jgi:cell division topological specificity factor